MFIANNWKDYEVIDTSEGEKLERWACKTRPAGYLEHTKKRKRLA